MDNSIEVKYRVRVPIVYKEKRIPQIYDGVLSRMTERYTDDQYHYGSLTIKRPPEKQKQSRDYLTKLIGLEILAT